MPQMCLSAKISVVTDNCILPDLSTLALVAKEQNTNKCSPTDGKYCDCVSLPPPLPPPLESLAN